jgi:hypothetical protein
MTYFSKEEYDKLLELRKTALKNLNITLSEKLLEELKKNREFVKVFVSKEFLQNVLNLNRECLENIASCYGVPSSSIPQLYLHKRNNKYFLALQSEQKELEKERQFLEEEKIREKRKSLAKVPIKGDFDLQTTLPPPKVTVALSKSEIERTKLLALTSSDIKEKLKALRTSMYLPIANSEKVYILTNALLDYDIQVKLDAIEFSRYFGVKPHLVEIFKELASYKDSQKKLALETLLGIAARLEGFEKVVLIILLLSFVKYEEKSSLINLAYEVLEKLVDKIATNEEWTLALIRTIIENLSENYSAYSDKSYNLLKSLLSVLSPGIQALVFKEIDSIPSKLVKALFLEVFVNIENLDTKIKTRLPLTIFNELKTWDEIYFECRKLGNSFTKLGFPALMLIIQNIDNIPLQQKQFFLRLITPLLRVVSIDSKSDKFFKRVLFPTIKRFLAKSSKQEFITFLEEELILNLPFPSNFRVKLAELVLEKVSEFFNERIFNLVSTTFLKMKEDVLYLLYKYYNKTYDTNMKKIILAIVMVTSSVYSFDKNGKIIGKFIKTLESDYALYNEIRGDILKALGTLHSVKNVPQEMVVNFYDFVKSELPKSKVPWAIIDALSQILLSPLLSRNIVIDIASILINIVSTPVPEIKMDEVSVGGKISYKIYGSIGIYTDLIPSALIALQRVCLHPNVHNALRGNILKILLEKYGKLSSLKEIWGPRSVSILISVIKNIVTSKYFSSSDVVEVLKSFQQSFLTLNIAEAVCDLLSSIEVSEQTQYYFEYYIKKMIEEINKLKNTGDYETTFYMLKLLSKLLGKECLALEKRKSVYLKEMIVSALIKAYNEQIGGAFHLLQEAVNIENLPLQLKRQIKLKIR